MKKNYFAITIISLFLVAVGTIGVRAFTSDKPAGTVIEYVQNFINEAPEAQTAFQEESLSGVAEVNNNPFVVNGEHHYTYTGSFADATTTLLRIPTPFSLATTTKAGDSRITDFTGASVSTSTVELIRLNITGPATSTAHIACGASSDGYDAIDIPLLGAYVATSSKGLIENNLATSTTDGTIGGGSTAKIHLTPNYPYFLCDATAPQGGGSEGSFTETTNTFDGTYTVRISR